VERAESWTVVSWNLQGRERPRVLLPSAALGAFDADVVALQEVRWWQAWRIARRLGMRIDWRLKHFPFTRFVFPFAEGAAILTPHELRRRGSTEISPGRPLTTYRRRIAQWATVQRADGETLQVFNAHLSPGSLADDRRAEARRLAELVRRRSSGHHQLIAGDLNDADEPEVIEILPLTEHARPAPTNPTIDPSQVLDHVLLPPGAVHERTAVPQTAGIWVQMSDHLPVIVTFRLPGDDAGSAG
jgi:endonuclease/exonuclease/phosphatase family metal-dependent hydrolase